MALLANSRYDAPVGGGGTVVKVHVLGVAIDTPEVLLALTSAV